MEADRGAWEVPHASIEQTAERPALRLAVIVRSELVRLGLRRMLRSAGMDVVAEAGDARAALALLRDAAADVVLVEAMPSAAALEALRRFVRSVPQRVVVLVGGADHRSVLEALAAGARGCVAADAQPDEIVTAVRAAARDEVFVSTALGRRLARELGVAGDGGSRVPPLSVRERQVLALVVLGWDNRQIAQELYLSPATVKHHIASIFVKLGVVNRVQAAVLAVQQGFDRSA